MYINCQVLMKIVASPWSAVVPAHTAVVDVERVEFWRHCHMMPCCAVRLLTAAICVCVVLCCCIAEGGSESPETSSEFLSRVNPSILELPDPTHSLSALPEGRNS